MCVAYNIQMVFSIYIVVKLLSSLCDGSLLQLGICTLLLQSPGSLVESQGRWLTGTEIDHVQQLLSTIWTGHGLESTTTTFIAPMKRPFIQVFTTFIIDCLIVTCQMHILP